MAVAIVSLAMISAYALTFPQLTGRVVDEAGVLDSDSEAAIAEKLAAVEAASGNQIVVVTLKSLQGTSIADFGYQLGRAWGLGQKEKNNGAMLVVAPTERKVRIEVGYGLEGSLTDAVTQLIIQNAILPRFRTGDYSGGIARGVDDIIQVVSGDADDFKRRAAQRPDSVPQGIDAATVVMFLLVLFFILSMLRNARGGGRSMRRGGAFAGPIFIPSGGSWSSGGGGGGGGFAGGGGSFGGGGSSGDW